MHRQAKCRARMLTGNVEQAAGNQAFGIPKACADSLNMQQVSFAGGLGGGAPAQRGARGAEPARIAKQHIMRWKAANITSIYALETKNSGIFWVK